PVQEAPAVEHSVPAAAVWSPTGPTESPSIPSAQTPAGPSWLSATAPAQAASAPAPVAPVPAAAPAVAAPVAALPAFADLVGQAPEQPSRRSRRSGSDKPSRADRRAARKAEAKARAEEKALAKADA